MQIGEKIKEIREQKGITLQELAKLTGFSSAILSQIENRLESPSLGTLLKIAKDCENVIWVKEASWDLWQIKDVINKTEKDFLVLSWDDSITYDLIKSWWDWVISVASNCIPKEVVNFVDLCISCSPKAKELNDYYNEFFTKLFIQTNPLPAKTFLADKWLIEEAFRLPICKIDNNEKKIFLDVVKKYNF